MTNHTNETFANMVLTAAHASGHGAGLPPPRPTGRARRTLLAQRGIREARILVKAFEAIPGVERRSDGAPLAQVLTDMMCALRHYCHQHDPSGELFETALRVSGSHFIVEAR